MVLESRLCEKYKRCEKVEFTGKSRKISEHFKGGMAFLRECMNEWEEVEDE